MLGVSIFGSYIIVMAHRLTTQQIICYVQDSEIRLLDRKFNITFYCNLLSSNLVQIQRLIFCFDLEKLFV
jgi:hypothetical protein